MQQEPENSVLLQAVTSGDGDEKKPKVSPLQPAADALKQIITPVIQLRRSPNQQGPSANSGKLIAHVKTEPKRRGAKKAFHNLVGVERIRNLSDGVIAIVITLIALEFHAPGKDKRGESSAFYAEMSDDQVVSETLAYWKTLLGYLACCLIIGIYWVSHAYTFAAIEGSDTTLAYLNLFFLLWCALTPFTVTVVTKYPTQYYAFILMNSVFFLMGLSLLFIWLYVMIKRKHIHDAQVLPKRMVAVVTFRYVLYPVIFALGICLAPASTWASLGVVLLVPLIAVLAALKFDVIQKGYDVIEKLALCCAKKADSSKTSAPKPVEGTNSTENVVVDVKDDHMHEKIQEKVLQQDKTIVVKEIPVSAQHGRRSLEIIETVRTVKEVVDEKKIEISVTAELKMDPHAIELVEVEEELVFSKRFNHFMVARINGLSDAVFSIVMTILVLELHIKEYTSVTTASQAHSLNSETPTGTTNSTIPTDAEKNAFLGQALIETWPLVLAYFVSIILVGSYWKMHSFVMRGIVRVTRRLLYMNIFFLSMVSLIPFTADLIGSWSSVHISSILYNSNLVIIGFSLIIILIYTYQSNLKPKGFQHPRLVILAFFRIVLGPVIYLIATGVAFANPYASIGVSLLVPFIDVLAAFHIDLYRILWALFFKVYDKIHFKLRRKDAPQPLQPSQPHAPMEMQNVAISDTEKSNQESTHLSTSAEATRV